VDASCPTNSSLSGAGTVVELSFSESCRGGKFSAGGHRTLLHTSTKMNVNQVIRPKSNDVNGDIPAREIRRKFGFTFVYPILRVPVTSRHHLDATKDEAVRKMKGNPLGRERPLRTIANPTMRTALYLMKSKPFGNRGGFLFSRNDAKSFNHDGRRKAAWRKALCAVHRTAIACNPARTGTSFFHLMNHCALKFRRFRIGAATVARTAAAITCSSSFAETNSASKSRLDRADGVDPG